MITERVNADQWKEIDRAEGGYDIYKDAMASGLVALQELISDLDVGPRRELKQSAAPQPPTEGTALPASSDAGKVAASPKAKPTKAAYFGFGPIR